MIWDRGGYEATFSKVMSVDDEGMMGIKLDLVIGGD